MNNLQIVEARGIRVLTTQQIADAYGTDSKVISKNFNNNKNRYEEGKHYIHLEGADLQEYLQSQNLRMQNQSKIRSLYLWTEKGALLHAKSLNTDKAWEVYDILVDTYFKKQETNLLEQMIDNPSMAYMGFMKAISENKQALETKVSRVEFEKFKDTLPVLAIDLQKITSAKNKVIVSLMGGKESNAYKDKRLRGKTYRDLESQIWREFGVPSVKALERNQVEECINLIKEYKIPKAIKVDIDNSNAQMGLTL